MRKFLLSVLLAGLVGGCTSVPKKQFNASLLVGRWRLSSTEHNGVVRQHSATTLVYRFTADGELISRIRERIFRGRWKLKGDTLFAWWPGRHRERHTVVRLSADQLSLLSRDGRLLSIFRKDSQ